MGMNCELRCDGCGYSLEVSAGVGMMYPNVCQNTLERIKAGDYGPDYQTDALNTPNAAVHIERELYRCTTCNALRNELTLELCAPIGRLKPRDVPFSSACPRSDVDYVMEKDIGTRYKVIRGQLHVCAHCGRLMIPVDFREKIPCPKCSKPLARIDGMCWD